MQKQHVKMNKYLSSCAVPSQPQSEMKLHSLHLTPIISSSQPLSSVSTNPSPVGTMENDTMGTHNTVDGCIFSKTAKSKRLSVEDNGILKNASSSAVRQSATKHKFRPLPHPPTPSKAASNRKYSLVSGNRSPDSPVGSVCSSVRENPSLSQHQLQKPSGQDLYNVVDKSARRNKPLGNQPVGSSAQSQDIYKAADKSVKFKQNKSSGQLLLSPTEESQDIVYRSSTKKRLVKSPQQQRHQQNTSEFSSKVQKKTLPVERERPKDVCSKTIKSEHATKK